MQIAIYARVSTGRQAENELSIPDQLRQMRQWAERGGHVVVKEYIEPGATATDDKRPVFQDMMVDATMKGTSPFQLIVVHSFSRFFRDHVEGAIYQRRLRKHGVRVESITQNTSDDPSGEMHRSMIMLFDEYQSKENAKHTLRGMQENARQGYFNGSKAPFGYKTIDAGQTGTRGRIKKKLAINEPEAEIVREIFDLYVNGRNAPRIGMKEIAKYLNAKKSLMRGKLWRIQAVQLILSSLTYSGWHVFNKLDSKTRKIKSEAEWVKIPVPAIIDQDLFDGATKLRAAHTPKMCAPRRESSPNLLTGLLKCDCCGATMVLQTAKNNQYRYYKCSARISKGDTACKSKSYPMDKLDNLVLEAFKSKIYTPEYIRAVVDTMRQNTNLHGGEEKIRLKKLDAELKDLEQAENKLFEAIEKGILELDDRLKARVQQNKTRRDALVGEMASLQPKSQIQLQTLTPQKIEAVARVLNRRFSETSPFSRAYLKATISEIRVNGDLLKLKGEHKTLANLIASNGKIDADKSVLGFIPDWRPLRDSNPCYYRESHRGYLSPCLT
ncbi:MAG: recombinase family protein, partial [Alphaproteobacteria bacterium]